MDLSAYFNSETYSDCKIVYIVSNATEEGASTARQCQPSPGHRIVLSGASERFRAEIDRWQFDQTDKCIELILAPAELESARLMIRYAYTQLLPADLDQQQLNSYMT